MCERNTNPQCIFVQFVEKIVKICQDFLKSRIKSAMENGSWPMASHKRLKSTSFENKNFVTTFAIAPPPKIPKKRCVYYFLNNRNLFCNCTLGPDHVEVNCS